MLKILKFLWPLIILLAVYLLFSFYVYAATIDMRKSALALTSNLGRYGDMEKSELEALIDPKIYYIAKITANKGSSVILDRRLSTGHGFKFNPIQSIWTQECIRMSYGGVVHQYETTVRSDDGLWAIKIIR